MRASLRVLLFLATLGGLDGCGRDALLFSATDGGAAPLDTQSMAFPDLVAAGDAGALPPDLTPPAADLAETLDLAIPPLDLAVPPLDLVTARDLVMAEADLSIVAVDLAARRDGSLPVDLARPTDLKRIVDLAKPTDFARPIDMVKTIDMARRVDMVVPIDLERPVDLAIPRDLARPVDFARIVDLAHPDLVPPHRTLNFAAPTAVAVGAGPWSLAASDFNGDGKLDLAVALHDVIGPANNLGILIGDGAGGFTLRPLLSAGTYPASVAAGDLNGDGRADLVVASWGPAASPGSVSVLLATGPASFAGAVPYGAGSVPNGVALGDFDRDGKLDAVVVSQGSPNGNLLSLLLGNGSGGLKAGPGYFGYVFPQAVQVADLDLDGKLDVVVAVRAGVDVALGNGNGTLRAPQAWPAGSATNAVVVADFNRDGRPDLATANLNSGDVGVLLANGAGGYRPTSYLSAGSGPDAIAAADLDLDGFLDLAIANLMDGTVTLHLGNGDGSFQGARSLPCGASPRYLLARDLNGDGKPDLEVADQTSGAVSVLLNTSM